ncbi:hypothetical protein PG989_011359 [Apiospora arundinis]
MVFTSPTTEQFPHYHEYGQQSPTPQMFGHSPRGLNPAAQEFITPTRTSGKPTQGNMPVNSEKRITTPLRLTPVTQTPIMSAPTGPPANQEVSQVEAEMAVNNGANNSKESKDRGKKEEQSMMRDFASSNESQKATTDSTIQADNTRHAEERLSPTKKTHGPWSKHNKNKKAKNQATQGNRAMENESKEHGRKDPGNKTQPKTSQQQNRGNKSITSNHGTAQDPPAPIDNLAASAQNVHGSTDSTKESSIVTENPVAAQSYSSDKPAKPADKDVDKQHNDKSKARKQDQADRKDTSSKAAKGKGKSASTEVNALPQPVVPGATWVETEPKKSTKKKSAKRNASKVKASAKPTDDSMPSAPASKESDVKGEKGEQPQTSKREDGSDGQPKGNQEKAGSKSQDTPTGTAPARSGTTAEAKKLEDSTNQANEGSQNTSKEPATTSQVKKWKGKNQKAPSSNPPISQTVTSQDKKQTEPSTPNEKLETERRDTMSSLSQADIGSILGDNDKVTLTSSGTKTPNLRDAPAPNGSPWRKDDKSKGPETKNEESNNAVPETLGEGEERKGG